MSVTVAWLILATLGLLIAETPPVRRT